MQLSISKVPEVMIGLQTGRRGVDDLLAKVSLATRLRKIDRIRDDLTGLGVPRECVKG